MTAPAAAAVIPSKMRLANLVKGKVEQPVRLTIYGPEGCGKSTFASNAPSPIFLGTEKGTAQLDITRFPSPSTFAEVIEAMRVLRNEKHDFKTLVLDTLDWAEPLVWSVVVANDKEGARNIEEVGGGYGKGYTAALDEWRKLLKEFELLQEAKQMHVVLLAHSHIKAFKNPQGPDYERYQLKMNEKAAGIFKEWSDAVLFANHEEFAQADKSKRVRGVSTGARLLYTQRTAAYDAKNRYGLPPELPLAWTEFEAAMKKGQPADPTALTEEIKRKAGEAGGELEKKTLESLGRCGGDASKLAILNDWLNAKVAAVAAQKGS